MGASYSGLYEEDEVEHINVLSSPALIMIKTESYLSKEMTQMLFPQSGPSVLTRKKKDRSVRRTAGVLTQ